MRRLIKTVALIDISRPRESITSARARNKLPKPRSRRCRKCRGLPGALDLSKPRHILRHAFFLKDLASTTHEHTGAIEADLHSGTSAAAVIIDELLDHRVYLKAKPERFIGNGVLDVCV